MKDDKVQNIIDDEEYIDRGSEQLEHVQVAAFLDKINNDEINQKQGILSHVKDEIIEREEKEKKNMTKLKETLTSNKNHRTINNITNTTENLANKSYAIR